MPRHGVEVTNGGPCLTSLLQRSSQMHKGAVANLVFLHSFRSKFGGGKSTGFCTIYDSEDAAKKYEPNYKSIRVRCHTVPCTRGALRLLLPTFSNRTG